MKLKVRCPSCTKLYEVESEDIHDETPLFQCVNCDQYFSFELTQDILINDEPQNILTFAVNASRQAEPLLHTEPSQQPMKSCPKCSALNNLQAQECYSCHVIFERLKDLPLDPTLKAQPSLVRKWKNLLENFDSVRLHDEFLLSCQQLEALPFAMSKYEEIRKAQGGDAFCDQIIAKIHSMLLAGLQQSPPPTTDIKVRPRWQKYIFWAPYVISLVLIVFGMTHLSHRNMIGLGVALTCMATGLIVMLKGRVSLSDFVD